MDAIFGAIDLGASSGRVIAGIFRNGRFSLREVYRFVNQPVRKGEMLVWDFDLLFAEIKRGVRELGATAERLGTDVTSIGIDTWAVDYGLLKSGRLLAPANCYRDPINQVGVERVHNQIPFSELYSITGIQYLQFNTIYQLARQMELDPETINEADSIVMLPDLIGYFLTGELATERTNASSTGLLDATTKQWSKEIGERLGLPVEKFPELRDAGDTLGKLTPGFGPRLQNCQVVLVGSHDTASAVAAVPATSEHFAFLSSGTWSLLGTELDEPILTSQSRTYNFTNELGVHNRVRFLKNLSGLWLLNESVRNWEQSGSAAKLPTLLEQASKLVPKGFLDVSDTHLIAPDDMPQRIVRQLEISGQELPQNPAEITAVILHSLARSYAENLELLSELTGREYQNIHLIGGGSLNGLLCQLTANYSGRTVEAGPVEATAIGNILVQAQSAGMVGPTLHDIRTKIRESDFLLRTYIPKGGT
jgi:rhamnulokinase